MQEKLFGVIKRIQNSPRSRSRIRNDRTDADYDNEEQDLIYITKKNHSDGEVLTVLVANFNLNS